MTKLSMQRTAADNPYLHQDFHGALSTGIDYLHRVYGEDAVRCYLRQFARAFYAPLTRELNARGLAAMREHLEEIYAIEGGEIALTGTEDELLLEVPYCPAVRHMRAQGYPVAALFVETTRTVYAAICEDTPFTAELLAYLPETGQARVRFSRRLA